MRKTINRKSKKAYSPPSLTAYGTVRELTRMVGMHGTKDGGTRNRARTRI